MVAGLERAKTPDAGSGNALSRRSAARRFSDTNTSVTPTASPARRNSEAPVSVNSSARRPTMTNGQLMLKSHPLANDSDKKGGGGGSSRQTSGTTASTSSQVMAGPAGPALLSITGSGKDGASKSSTGSANESARGKQTQVTPPSQPAPQKKAPAALAARRNVKPESINTEKQAETPRQGGFEAKKIKKVPNALEHYDLGRQVMPSCHRGMEVLFAKSKATGKDCVIKVRHKDQSFHDVASEREWRESTEFVMNLPSSPAIAQIYEVLEDQRAYYVVMEKVSGRDLFETMSGSGLLPMHEVKEVMRQLLTALDELHARGGIHKDLKLENVMFERLRKGREEVDPASPVKVKLIDFDTVEECSPTMKRAKDVLGTDQYIAQEAYDGVYSPASDIFAAGVIGFRICTGKFPFRRDLFNDEAGENWVGSPKMKEIRQKLCNFKIDWSHKTFVTDPQAKNLIRWMLTVNERQRPTAKEALAHPWLSHAGGGAGSFQRSSTAMDMRAAERQVTPPPSRGRRASEMIPAHIAEPSRSPAPHRSRPSLSQMRRGATTTFAGSEKVPQAVDMSAFGG